MRKMFIFKGIVSLMPYTACPENIGTPEYFRKGSFRDEVLRTKVERYNAVHLVTINF